MKMTGRQEHSWIWIQKRPIYGSHPLVSPLCVWIFCPGRVSVCVLGLRDGLVSRKGEARVGKNVHMRDLISPFPRNRLLTYEFAFSLIIQFNKIFLFCCYTHMHTLFWWGHADERSVICEIVATSQLCHRVLICTSVCFGLCVCLYLRVCVNMEMQQ